LNFFFKSFINTGRKDPELNPEPDPDPEGPLITDPPDPDPQHCYETQKEKKSAKKIFICHWKK
jgi:hypothetical protein